MLGVQLMQQEKQRQILELRKLDALCIEEQLAAGRREELQVLHPLVFFHEQQRVQNLPKRRYKSS